MDRPDIEVVLDAASDLVTEDGFDAASLPRIAQRAGVTEEQIFTLFPALQDLFVSMLNREYGLMFRVIIDNIERDPRGGLVSSIYRYTLTAVYERPLARALYLMDRDGLNTIMRSAHGFSYVPQLGVRAAFIERMREAGMVREDVSAAHISAVLSAVSAGAALTAPHSDLDSVTEGLVFLLGRAVDADVTDTAPGKAAFIEYASSLATDLGRA